MSYRYGLSLTPEQKEKIRELARSPRIDDGLPHLFACSQAPGEESTVWYLDGAQVTEIRGLPPLESIPFWEEHQHGPSSSIMFEADGAKIVILASWDRTLSRAEMAKITGLGAEATSDAYYDTLTNELATAERAGGRIDLEAARRDAARYRWLRSEDSGYFSADHVNDRDEALDEAIDEAMKAGQRHGVSRETP